MRRLAAFHAALPLVASAIGNGGQPCRDGDFRARCWRLHTTRCGPSHVCPSRLERTRRIDPSPKSARAVTRLLSRYGEAGILKQYEQAVWAGKMPRSYCDEMHALILKHA